VSLVLPGQHQTRTGIPSPVTAMPTTTWGYWVPELGYRKSDRGCRRLFGSRRAPARRVALVICRVRQRPGQPQKMQVGSRSISSINVLTFSDGLMRS
jgi:hypothetical protein